VLVPANIRAATVPRVLQFLGSTTCTCNQSYGTFSALAGQLDTKELYLAVFLRCLYVYDGVAPRGRETGGLTCLARQPSPRSAMLPLWQLDRCFAFAVPPTRLGAMSGQAGIRRRPSGRFSMMHERTRMNRASVIARAMCSGAWLTCSIIHCCKATIMV
jgi:hypothetical protein